MADELTILREKVSQMVVENPLARLRVKYRCQKKHFTKLEAIGVLKKAKKSGDQFRKECRMYYCPHCKRIM